MRKYINPFLVPEYLSSLIWTKIDGNLFVSSCYAPKPYRALPEAIIRQLWVILLIDHYGYPESMLRLEYKIQMGITKKRADIAILSASGNVHTIIEVKQVINEDARNQLQSYMRTTTATHGAVVSMTEFFAFECSDRRLIIKKEDLPKYGGMPDLFDHLTQAQDQQVPVSDINIEQLKKKLSIEDFTRIDSKRVRITVKGASVVMANSAMTSYAKLRKMLLDEGASIDPNFKQNDWQNLFSALFDAADCSEFSRIDLNEEQATLIWLLAKPIQISRSSSMTVKELIIENKRFEFAKMNSVDMTSALAKSGLRILDDALFIGNPFGNQIFHDSPYEKIWRNSLLRLAGVKSSGHRSVKINRVSYKCIYIPLNLIFEIISMEKHHLIPASN